MQLRRLPSRALLKSTVILSIGKLHIILRNSRYRPAGFLYGCSILVMGKNEEIIVRTFSELCKKKKIHCVFYFNLIPYP